MTPKYGQFYYKGDFFSRHELLAETSCRLEMTVLDSSGDIGFEQLITQHHPLPLTQYIPKAAHFVHSQLQPQTWLNYAIIRSAFCYLGVEKVSIWVPEDAELPGEMWERIRAMQNVTIRPFTVPTTVWGTRIQRVEHASDIVRIKILYQEGGTSELASMCRRMLTLAGIYMDNDMIALKSSDDIIYSPDTKSTVLPRQAIYGQGKAVLNAMIMSKPGSPFLLRWMEKYKELDPSEWDRTSCLVPAEMWNAGEPELTLLHDRTWVYPQLRTNDELRTDRPALSLMWVGKSWHDIGNNYGSHLWRWADGSRKVEVNPEIVRTIDTPIFCKMRRLFDNVDGDGHYSVPVDRNPNCSFTSMVGLKSNKYSLFSDYQIRLDTANTKWVDSSGNRLHGFSQTGTYINRTEESIVREFTMNSQAWLPVPSDWDARVGTVRMQFQLDRKATSGTTPIGLFKIRVDYAGEIVVSLVKVPTANALLLHFEWLGTFLAKGKYAQIDNAEWISDGQYVSSPRISNSSP